MNGQKLSIRMSGLGGQGVVTAAHILGAAAYRADLQVTVNPFFGAEKRLAPAESYVRISQEKILERGEILYPNIIMIFHPHVITLGKCYTMPFFDGLRPGGSILINSHAPLDLVPEDRENLKRLNAKIFYVPATEVAMQVSGTELSTNISMIGGLYGIRQITSTEALEAGMTDRFGGAKFVASGTTAALDDVVKEKFGKISQMIEKNMEVIRHASEKVFAYSL
jgi:pyruvate ferredoxin oxidoreductase gamma subunit